MDKIFRETGIDERDYFPNIIRLEMLQDEELRMIPTQYYQWSQNYYVSRKAEIEQEAAKQKATDEEALEIAKKVTSEKTAVEKEMDA